MIPCQERQIHQVNVVVLLLKNCTDPPDETQAESTVLIMECVLRREKNEEIKDLLDHVRNDTLVRADHHVKSISNKILYHLPDYKQAMFRHAIHLVSQ